MAKKFQAKYSVEVDRESTYEIARSKGFKAEHKGGAPTRGGEPGRAQVVIPLREFDATIVIGHSIVQVHWPEPYDNIEKIEGVLQEIVVLNSGENTKFWFGKDTRKDMPTIPLYRREGKTMSDELDFLKTGWKLVEEGKAEIKKPEEYGILDPRTKQIIPLWKVTDKIIYAKDSLSFRDVIDAWTHDRKKTEEVLRKLKAIKDAQGKSASEKR